MSNRPSSRVDRGLLLTSAGVFAALGLFAGCSQPAPMEAPPPPPAPMADASQTELMGAPPEMPADGQAYAQAEPLPFGPPMVEDDRRPGWGTMAPVPSPGDPGYEAPRAYAQAEPDPRPYRELNPEAPPYAEPQPFNEPAPAPYTAGEAPFPEGIPTAGAAPMVITMEPVPNPDDGYARPDYRTDDRSAADAALAGGPSRERPARAARRETPRAAAPTRRAEAPRRPQAGYAAAPARPAAKPAKPVRQDARNPQALRNAGLDQVRQTLANLVRRDASFTAPRSIVPGEPATVTLTLPAGLAATLTQESRRAGVRELASEARIRATLSGDGWRIVPAEPQTESVRPGAATTFDWQATPERGARPLTASIAAELAGGAGPVETLELGTKTQVLEDGAPAGGGGGLSARAIAAAVLLLLALGAVFYFLRRRDDEEGVIGGGRRGGRRRRPEPVHLTPYAPGADPAGSRDTSPV